MKRIIKCTVDNVNKVIRLEQMDEVLKCMNNEDAYESWMNTICFNAIDAQEANEDVFEYIAKDAELYEEACELYEELYKEFRSDGLYKPTPTTFNFAQKSDKAFGFTDRLEVFE